MTPVRDPETGKFLKSQADPKLATTTDGLPEPGSDPTPPPLEQPPEKEIKEPEPEASEELQALAESFLGDTKVKPPEGKKKDKPPTKPVTTKPPLAKPTQPTQPTQPAPGLTAEQIASATAEGVAKAMGAQREREKAAPEAPAVKLPDKEARKVQILQVMEKLYPDKYKGISTKYAESVTKLQEYAKKWETDHPGQEFDGDSEEHEEFFAEHDVDWEEDDYQEAIADIRADAKLAEASKQTDSRLAQIERAEKLREKERDIYTEQTRGAKNFWELLGEDFKTVIQPNGTTNLKFLEEFAKQSPDEWATYVHTATALELEIAELYKLYDNLTTPMINYNGNDPKLVQTSMIHRNLINFGLDEENYLLSQPVADRTDEQGRTFLRAADYFNLPQAQREKYWTFGFRELADLRSKRLADHARKIVEKNEEDFRRRAEARGIKLEPKSQRRSQATKEEEEPPPEPDDEKPHSPTSASPSKMAVSREQVLGTAKNGAEAFVLRGL